MAAGNVKCCLYLLLFALQNLYSYQNICYKNREFKYLNCEWKKNQDGRQNSKCLPKIDRFYSSKDFVLYKYNQYLWYQHAFFRISAQYNNTAKKSWDTCHTTTGIQDGGQNSKRLPAMLSISQCISMTKWIFVWKCVCYETYMDVEFKIMNSNWNENQNGQLATKLQDISPELTE